MQLQSRFYNNHVLLTATSMWKVNIQCNFNIELHESMSENVSVCEIWCEVSR